jgi:hypothetical protein
VRAGSSAQLTQTVDPTSDDLQEIESAASKITVQGARYFEHLERLTGRLDVHIATLPA